MVTIRRVLLQEKDEGGNIFKQIKFLHKEVGISLWKAIKLGYNIAFKGKTLLVQLEPGGNPARFDAMHTKSKDYFDSSFVLMQQQYMGLFIDKCKYDFVPEITKDVTVWISTYKGVS